ncbi:uncharacterized protein TRUGW13939_01951 [Talaromyces rugulosus]|uniref:RING-type domain-containing protein n=1 Tax=Talaromyces rugulosus TaxID=121627 RepID=A0A7H8QMU1_TALRU|nr:uncharacterized protein TRUGW13939_01951 [Talaromyces rugulosus]QKX54861.1 hypothetical protein TRUGW13939_01951 [Talaromyces rugulosus]
MLETQAQVQDDLNKSLGVLAHLFPDIRVEVFRELLTRFDGNSRLHLCVEQLLRHKDQWVQGRWKLQPVDGADESQEDTSGHDQEDKVPPHELFRSKEYKDTVKMVLSKEFSALSRSTIDAVLAESNFSYTRARPILKEVSRKGWRATLSNLNPFKRKKDKDENPLVVWDRSAEGGLQPRLKKTGSGELDLELYEVFILPFLRDQKEMQEIRDFLLSLELSEQEARVENALYECQCCLDDVTFEQISTCSSDGHVICFSCIRRTMHEALFGQGWDNSVSPAMSTLKCVAPVSHGVCDGHLSPTLIKQAILLEKAGSETYRKFEERVASEALLKSRLKLVHCPFCTYAEVDPVFHPANQKLEWHYRRGNIFTTILTTIFLLDLIPLLSIPLLIPLLFYPNTLTAIFRTSLQNMSLRSRSQRFLCKNPSCRRPSCMTCRKRWRDPHSCEEPLQQSLRTTVEAARTASIKRTCPRCNLSFVKSSGCNKLTCVCGYSMCYLCRKALNSTPGDTTNNNNNNNDEDADVGYKHFCAHFRVNPGAQCSECNKCELYKAEDDEEIARRAGEKAEREWRMRQSLAKGSSTTSKEKAAVILIDTTSSSLWDPDSAQQQQHLLLNSVLHQGGKNNNNNNAAANSWRYWCSEVWRDGRWRWEVQAAADMIVEKVIVVDV